MAAADQLIALVTKTAEKLNALNTAIGTKANIGVSSDAGNNLSVGSDSKPYFNASNIPLGVSSDADNALILGTDDKPYLENDLFVPSTRILSAGTGINTIGDLSANRSITLDFDYLDTRYGSGFKQREAVRVATTGNITLSGLQTIDGVVLVAGDRVLVRKQTNAAQNGVYVASSTAWTRATDFDEPDIEEVTQGASVYVEDGTLLKGTGWTLQTPPPYVIGTTELDFIQYAGAGSYTGGNLITINGNQINHDSGSWTSKSNLSGATVISNLSVDAYGHLTNWTTRNLTPSNIGAEPSFSKNTAFNKNFGTSAGTVAQGNDSRINNGQTAYSWGNHASAGYVPSSRTISTGTHLSGGGDLSANRTLVFTPTVNNWVLDNEGNQRIFLGGTISTNGVLFQASASGQEFQYRNSLGTKQFWITDTGSINGSNIITSGSGNFGSTVSITGSTPTVRFIQSGSAFDWRIITSSDNISFRKQGLSGTSLIMRSDNTNEFFGTLTASNLSGTNTGDQTWSTLGGKPSTFTPSAHTHPASDITSGTFANARISQSSVTQHEAAINAGSVDGKHIWAGTEDNLPSSRNSNTIYFAY